MKNPYIGEMITALLAIVLGIVYPMLIGDGTVSIIVIPIGIIVLINAIKGYKAVEKSKDNNSMKGGKAAWDRFINALEKEAGAGYASTGI